MQAINDISERHAEVNSYNVRKVTSVSDIEAVSQLAEKIWRDHYMPIIGAAQVEYMLANFQSPLAISKQLAAGYHYYLLLTNQQPLAYFAWMTASDGNSLQLSKLYVDKSFQRQGIGSQIINLSVDYCQSNNLQSLWLTVNRHNHSAINFYLRNDFENVAALVKDIGGGFVMDDFKMEKQIVR
jgi:ribosomal protein S18 acetylase RimI-like enzyme